MCVGKDGGEGGGEGKYHRELEVGLSEGFSRTSVEVQGCVTQGTCDTSTKCYLADVCVRIGLPFPENGFKRKGKSGEVVVL